MPFPHLHQPPDSREEKKPLQKKEEKIVLIGQNKKDVRKEAPNRKQILLQLQGDFAREMLKKTQERRRATERNVYCATCDRQFRTVQREDRGIDAPVEIIGICPDCAPHETGLYRRVKKKQKRHE